MVEKKETLADKLARDLKTGKAILLRNESYQDYVEELKYKLETLDEDILEDGKLPEHIVEIVTKDGMVVLMKGNKDYLKDKFVRPQKTNQKKPAVKKSED